MKLRLKKMNSHYNTSVSLDNKLKLINWCRTVNYSLVSCISNSAYGFLKNWLFLFRLRRKRRISMLGVVFFIPTIFDLLTKRY